MALPAAMILSGLPREQFSTDIHLQDIYNRGAVLLKSPSSSSVASSTASSSYHSVESDFSSTSTETPAKKTYNQAVANKSPSVSSSSGSSTASSSYQSMESGISSVARATSTAKVLEFYIDVISQLEVRLQSVSDTPMVKREVVDPEPKIYHFGRDILNLADNIKTDTSFKPADLPGGFLPNITLFAKDTSFLDEMKKCPHTDCGFNELLT